MQLSTKYGWIKWIPFVLSVAFGLIVLGERLELIDPDDERLALGLEAIVGAALIASLILWSVCATTLCCPNCGRLVGSQYDVRICRQCGTRL